MSHILMSHVTHSNKTWHTDILRMRHMCTESNSYVYIESNSYVYTQSNSYVNTEWDLCIWLDVHCPHTQSQIRLFVVSNSYIFRVTWLISYTGILRMARMYIESNSYVWYNSYTHVAMKNIRILYEIHTSLTLCISACEFICVVWRV